jgi:hypothetical protein
VLNDTDRETVRRWFCDEKHCSRGSFTDSVAALPDRSRLTNRLRSEAGQRVVDGTCATVVAAGRQLGLSWPTVMEAVREQAEVSLPPEREPVGVLGIDEVRRGSQRDDDPARPGLRLGPARHDASDQFSVAARARPFRRMPGSVRDSAVPTPVGRSLATVNRLQLERASPGTSCSEHESFSG